MQLDDFNKSNIKPCGSWHCVPYVILGVKLYSVENDAGVVMCYCDTEQQAMDKIKILKKGGEG